MTVSTVMSQDTPWRDIHTLLIPAYIETWVMVGIVMVVVLSIGGLLGVILF